ncbi:MAG: N-acetylmuramoyl-L-alanine amidase [bacterium]
MPDPRTYHLALPKSKRPAEIALGDPWYPGVGPHWASCTTKRSVDPIHGVVAVVIHATAGSSSAGAVSVMARAENPASFHWLVPDEDEPQHGKLVWACVPEALAAWHVRNAASHPDVNGGAKRVNHWSLGIEVVNAQQNDPFSAWQLEATARIVRYCWAKYPNLVDVVSHAKLDPSRRSDPGANFDWPTFERLILEGVDDPVPALVAAAPALDTLTPPATNGCCDGG